MRWGKEADLPTQVIRSVAGRRYRLVTGHTPIDLTHTYSRSFVSNQAGTLPLYATDAPGAPLLPGADVSWKGEYALGDGTLRTGSYPVFSGSKKLGTRVVGSWAVGSLCLWATQDGDSDQSVLDFFTELSPQVKDGYLVIKPGTNTFSHHGDQVTAGVRDVASLLLGPAGRDGSRSGPGQQVPVGFLYRTTSAQEPLLLETSSVSATFAFGPAGGDTARALRFVEDLRSLELL